MNILNSPHLQMLVPSLVEFNPVVLGKKVFELLVTYSYLPFEKDVVIHLKNLNYHHPRTLCAKFG